MKQYSYVLGDMKVKHNSHPPMSYSSAPKAGQYEMTSSKKAGLGSISPVFEWSKKLQYFQNTENYFLLPNNLTFWNKHYKVGENWHLAWLEPSNSGMSWVCQRRECVSGQTLKWSSPRSSRMDRTWSRLKIWSQEQFYQALLLILFSTYDALSHLLPYLNFCRSTL